MMLRVAFMASWLVFVAACSEQIGPRGDASPQEPAEEPVVETPAPAAPAPVVLPNRPTSTSGEATINWDAARTDLASNGSDTAAPSGFQIQSGADAPPVPVLLPTGIVTTQSAPDEAPRFRQMADGYFARYPGVAYDITVSGTNEVFDTPGDTAKQNEDANYRSTATGAMVTIGRYGADYMIEFECNGAAGALGDGCIDEANALEIARSLVIVGSR
ncbi:MAG: hypothetical protein AAF216_04150 [Pseudomonadota bacterium]